MIHDWQHREALHIAVQDGDLALVQKLVKDGRDINQFDEALDRTPLHYAAEREDFAIACFLLSHGANVNARCEAHIGETPLGHVAAACSYEMAELLINAGANPTIPGWMQITALDRARERKKPEGRKVYEFLLDVAKRKFNHIA